MARTRSSSSGKSASVKMRAYLASLPADASRHVQKMREIIRAAAPGAVESFGYGMPAFELDGKGLVWYAVWKQHSSLYPLSATTSRALAAELKEYDTSGRGTIRFPLDEPLPSALVARLVRARIAEMRGKNKRR